MLEIFLNFNYILVFFALLYASYTDIKYRIVDNWLSWGLFFIGIVLNIIYGIILHNSLIYYFLFVLVVFIIVYIMWLLGVFAGGDAKIYLAIASNIPFQTKSIFHIIHPSLIPLVISVFILSLFLILPFGLFQIIKITITNKVARNEFKKGILANTFKTILSSFVFITLFIVLWFLGLSLYLVIPLSFIVAFLPRNIKLILSLPFAIYSFYLNPLQNIKIIFYFLLSSYFLWFFIYSFYLFKSGVFNIKKKVKDLKDGDILAYPLYLEDKTLKPLKIRFISDFYALIKKGIKEKNVNSIKKFLKKHKDLKSKIVINNNFAGGLTIEQIKTIEKYLNKNFVLELKQSLPLVPTIFGAYVLLIVFGDIIWYLINIL